MIRDERDFESLIWELERTSKTDPAGYRRRVALVAGLGYIYVCGLLVALSVALFGVSLLGFWWLRVDGPGVWPGVLLLSILPGIMIVGILSVVVDALMSDIQPPKGNELRRDVAPELYRLLDELSTKLKTPKLHRVMVSTDFNAGVEQYPQYGVFGKSLSYLFIGIPLMKALSPDQLRAVLAHELGHISGNHSRFSGRIYNLNRAWSTLGRGIKRESRLVHPFMRWYVPYFNAFSFALRRGNEYEADRRAAELAGAENVAATLIATDLYGRYLDDKYWPALLDRASEVAVPDVRPYTNVFTGDAFPSPADQESWYRDALDEGSWIADTHPCLTDRLAALGFHPLPGRNGAPARPPVPIPKLPKQSAADIYLGKWLGEYTQMLDTEWKHLNRTAWAAQFEKSEAKRSELKELDDQYLNGSLGEPALLHFAILTYEIKGTDKGISLMRQLCDSHPDFCDFHHLLGMWLLKNGDDSGIVSLERSATLEPRRKLGIYRNVADFLNKQNQPDRARSYDLYVKQNSTYGGRISERIVVKRSDRLMQHGLPLETVAQVCDQLRRVPKIRAAYLAQLQKRRHVDRPVYLVVIEPTADAFGISSYVDVDHFVFEASRELDLPGDMSVEIACGRMKWIIGALAGLTSAKILQSF